MRNNDVYIHIVPSEEHFPGLARVHRARRTVKLGAGVILFESDPRFSSSRHSSRSADPHFVAFFVPCTKEAAAWIIECSARDPRIASGSSGVALCPVFDEASSYDEDAARVSTIAKTIKDAGIRVAVECSVITPPDLAADIFEKGECDAVIVSEFIPWESVGVEARDVFFRTRVSPYDSPQGGMVSGKYVIPLAAEWIRAVRRRLPRAYIAAGGALRPRDVESLRDAGASALYSGVAAPRLRPWNMSRVRQAALRFFS